MYRKIVYSIFFILCLMILGAGLGLRHLMGKLPSVDSLEHYMPNLTTRLLDCRGNVIAELYTERRVWTPINQIPVDMQNAFIAIEDDNFFDHYGISPGGMVRAALRNFLAGRVRQGGSTITQQLSKIIFLTRERTMTRKIKELLLSLQIESRFSKQEILQMYLNQVYFGHGAYGAAAAAKVFYGKTVDQLNLAECALLSGLPRLPGYYSPFLHPERAKVRRAVVLRRLLESGYITPEEEKAANAQPLGIGKVPFKQSYAPYFVERLRQELESKYGSQQLYHGGLNVYTTLDLKMQMISERIMEQYLAQFDKDYGPAAADLRLQEKQEKVKTLRKSFPDKKFSEPRLETMDVQGALVILDVHTGAVRALIGGRNFAKSQFNRATQAKRQPGSAFKAFVWLSALQNGMTAASMVEDAPLLFKNNGQDWQLVESANTMERVREEVQNADSKTVWAPGNYDGKYLGKVTLRRALAASRNTVAVRLIHQLGAMGVADLAQRLGIQSALDPVRALALGSSVVDLLEITSAFAVFPGQGVRAEPYMISKVTDFSGRVLEETFPKQSEVLSAQLSFLMTQLLRAVVLEGTAVYAQNTGAIVAGKTGTSQDHRDAWFIGFTPELACGAWMGYDDFSQLGRKTSSGVVLVPWWTEIMKEILKDQPTKDFDVPSGIEFVNIDRNTGYLAAASCPRVVSQAFASGTAPKQVCPVNHANDDAEIETED